MQPTYVSRIATLMFVRPVTGSLSERKRSTVGVPGTQVAWDGSTVPGPTGPWKRGTLVGGPLSSLVLVTGTVAIGEVTLSGDLRVVPGLAKRVAEAARLGFSRVIIPADAGWTPA